MKKCAVIGSQGYIGRHIAAYLGQMSCDVQTYDLPMTGEGKYTQCDLVNREEISKIDLSVDYIFMFAGLTGTYAGFDRYEQYVSVNEVGLLNLLDAIRHSECRPKLIYPSTRLVYKGKDCALAEDDEKETKTIYAVNKLACEGILQAYAENFDIPYTIFRICVPFGNMLGTDYSFGTVGFFIRQAQEKGVITLYGGGQVRRTFTSMKDLCDQIVRASFHKESVNATYNVGGREHSLKEAAEIVASHYGARVQQIPYPERDARLESGSTYFDSSRIEKLLGTTEYEDLTMLF